MDTKFSGLPAFIWSVADLLRGDFKQSQYGRIILPFTILRRLECVLAPTKAAVLAHRMPTTRSTLCTPKTLLAIWARPSPTNGGSHNFVHKSGLFIKNERAEKVNGQHVVYAMLIRHFVAVYTFHIRRLRLYLSSI